MGVLLAHAHHNLPHHLLLQEQVAAHGELVHGLLALRWRRSQHLLYDPVVAARHCHGAQQPAGFCWRERRSTRGQLQIRGQVLPALCCTRTRRLLLLLLLLLLLVACWHQSQLLLCVRWCLPCTSACCHSSASCSRGRVSLPPCLSHLLCRAAWHAPLLLGLLLLLWGATRLAAPGCSHSVCLLSRLWLTRGLAACRGFAACRRTVSARCPSSCLILLCLSSWCRCCPYELHSLRWPGLCNGDSCCCPCC
jgi:hypothetical protein